ncbi:MAG: DUF4126 family protein [Deltaproteobacteria bacterium]|nr:DUF4126 family protein [Deltaproteobacteria bacterium]
MDAVETIALSMGVGWAAGLNLYAAVFMLGLLSTSGNLVLPDELALVADPLVMGAAALMYCVEFFADKIPGVDTGWDAIHTFVRIPAGAVLAAGAVGDVGEPARLAAGLLGGTLAAGSHFTKAGTRAAVNVSPEPVTNWAASLSEDVAVVGGLWAALYHPWVFLVGLVLFVALVVWLTPKIVRGVRRLFSRRRDAELPAASPNGTRDVMP